MQGQKWLRLRWRSFSWSGRERVAFVLAYNISNDPNYRPKHPGVPDGCDGSDGTSYALTGNYTLPVAQLTGRVAYVPSSVCGDVYTSSELHLCYTLRRSCSYAEAVYTTPGDWRQAWEHLGAPATNLGAPATCLGAPRSTVMYSVCILIYVSMYQYSYPSTHAISGLAAVCRIYTPRHPVHLRYPFDRACLRCTWRRRLSELRDAPGGRDWPSLEMHLETEIEWTQKCTWRPGSSELRYAFGGHHRANLQAVIEPVWRYTWRPWSSESGDTLGGLDRARLDQYLEAADGRRAGTQFIS